MNRRTLAWERLEIAHIRMHWSVKTDKELGDELGRTAMAVRDKRQQLGLIRPNGAINLSIERKIRRMKELIALCEANPSPPIKDVYKLELMKLSGLW